MSEKRVVKDPSRLHLKNEIKKKAGSRALRDPGTSSSWKRSPDPSSSSRSAAFVSGSKKFDNAGEQHVSSLAKSGENEQKRVFLYNWKTHSAVYDSNCSVRDGEGFGCGDNDNVADNDNDDDVSLSGDSRLVGDSKSDAYVESEEESRFTTSAILRCRDDAALVSVRKRASKKVRKVNSNSFSTHLDVLSRYQQKEMNLSRLLKGKSSHRGCSSFMGLGSGRDDSMELSDGVEDYSNSEDLRKNSGMSPYLLKLKHRNWSRSSSRLLRSHRRGDSSYSYSTPALSALSASSYNRYLNRNPSAVGSWDATTNSLNGGDDELDEHLDFQDRQGCGIPCYWSRRTTPRHRGSCGSCYSPSLADSLKRKGSSILCGSQSIYQKHPRSSAFSDSRKIVSKSSQGLLPLLANDGTGKERSSTGSRASDDELSTNYGELDLEALSRLDGRRWSSCRSQDRMDIVPLHRDGEEEGTPENIRSFSQKYRPLFFGELVGQDIVVQSLTNAISKGRIAPVYLFQGPRGTGKTSTAKIFASALNCVNPEHPRPCGFCRGCNDFISGKARGRNLWEIDGTNKKEIDRVRYILKKVFKKPKSSSSNYKVFLIDECHLLPSKLWIVFLKFVEEPPEGIVFIFVSTDPDNLPTTVQSRCQKYIFNKIKDGDIVARLRKISSEENLAVDLDALELIALNADGSLRDAETMLDQLSLLGKRITTSLVNELLGVVSDEKLLELLEFAMSSDTAETVKRARDLMDSGADPMGLMSQLASLIMDIIAGSHNDSDAKYVGRSLAEVELEKLKHALKLLSEAEKRLRVSNDPATWFTATLLQLGSQPSPDVTQSSRRHSSRTTEEDMSSASREATFYKHKSDLPQISSSPSSLHKSMNLNLHEDSGFKSKNCNTQLVDSCSSSGSLGDEAGGDFRDKVAYIWEKCIEMCHSKTLRQLLHYHGKLLSITEAEGILLVSIGFSDEVIKARAERFLSSITNSIEMVLRHNVEVRILLISDVQSLNVKRNQANSTIEQPDSSKLSKTLEDLLPHVNSEKRGRKERIQEIPLQKVESINREHRLETAWLQSADAGTPASLSRSKPDKKQVVPQEDICRENLVDPVLSMELAAKHAEDELDQECKVSKVNDHRVLHKVQTVTRTDHHHISPSLLHDNKFVSNSTKETQEYDTSSAHEGCNSLFCWNTNKSRKNRVRGTPVRTRHRSGRRFSLFGKCRKYKNPESRI